MLEFFFVYYMNQTFIVDNQFIRLDQCIQVFSLYGCMLLLLCMKVRFVS